MLSKKMTFSNFSRAITSSSECYRPDNEKQLSTLMALSDQTHKPMLARGNGLSYSDCCVNEGGVIVSTSRLNHLLAFDESTGNVICQAAVTFADLFHVHPDFIPPVLPGTLHITLGGGVANDIHGKNNVRNGTLGKHLLWLDVQMGNEIRRLSPTESTSLFKTTVAGLGLTGIITRVALRLQKKSRFVMVQAEKHKQWDNLLDRMQQQADKHDYQVAWLDLLNPQHAVLSFASHCDDSLVERRITLSIPPLPFRLVSPWGMTLFNRYFFKKTRTNPHVQSLARFNNPLDSIAHWNRLYGKDGLRQFQAVFDAQLASEVLDNLTRLIHRNKAIPTLAVLKYFSQPGYGLLSFVQPGVTIAIDFINNTESKMAIKAMNELITQVGGKIYLAKDLLLTEQQFARQYPNHRMFRDTLDSLPGRFQSELSRRLGLNL